MGRDPSPPATAPARLTAPKRDELLGQLTIGPAVTQPLGGLNPHNPHFDKIGTQFHQIMVEHAGLQKHHHVLDIGCGTGRLTKPLTRFLNRDTYHGFDANRRYLSYCEQYTSNLTWCDVLHPEYNPDGALDAKTFEFPYQPRKFDVVVALAVFNHFHTSWVFQYVREASRVLKPRGVLIFTAILLNQRSMQFINGVQTQPYAFPHRTPESWHDFESRPLWNVAQPEDAIRRVCIKSNLTIKEPIRYGEWCNSPVALLGPDVIIAKKGGWGH
jgi:2-polyprenyl-3-methyl-5-hydroxy-6-metoxy-1,4-benzoquinol methylase